MAEVAFIKTTGGVLLPANDSDFEAMESVKNGSLVVTKITKKRNGKFHRKFFKMLDFGFDYWEPELPVYKGMVALKNREKFRDDMIILAGHYYTVVGVNGKIQVKPKSISFAAMDDIEFNQVYKSVFNVVWDRVIKHVNGFTEESMENAINQLMSFN